MIKRNISYFLWTVIGILLFSLSFPGYFNDDGIPYAAFVAIFPLFYIVSSMNYKESIFYGFCYGVGTYLLFNYWLKSFDPITFSILPTIMGSYYLLLFVICKYIYRNYNRFTYIPLTLAWLLYEIFKGENPIGYTYGTLSHSMYKSHLFTGIADITGVYVLSLIIVFPSIFLAVLLSKGIHKFSRKEITIVSVIYFTILISSIIYTYSNRVNLDETKTLRVALIQHNIDSWADGNNEVYKETLDTLIELSMETKHNNPDLLIWSENAFVPAIEWHKKYRLNPFRYNLVLQLENFISSNNSDFIIGNNETIGLKDDEKIFHNSAYHYSTNGIVSKYRKNKLVPFTENFPFPKQMPWLDSYIKSIGGKSITPGVTTENFTVKSYKITPLICYEDTFQGVVRKGIKLGGELIVNITNDAWSSELACSKQHLSAALFRSIENRRTFVRVGTGGYSCVIDPNGEIIASLEPLTKGQITFDVPIYSGKTTFFTTYGNIIEKILLSIFILILLYRPFKSTLLVLQKVKQ